MAIFDTSFGIDQQEFDRYYKDVTDAELLILKYQALDFLFFIKGMYKHLSEEMQLNQLKVISKNNIHNVLLLIRSGVYKLLDRDESGFNGFVGELVKMSPLDFQKYILTKRKWGVQNKNIISIIEDFLNKNGQQELDSIKNIINELVKPSLDAKSMTNCLQEISCGKTATNSVKASENHRNDGLAEQE